MGWMRPRGAEGASIREIKKGVDFVEETREKYAQEFYSATARLVHSADLVSAVDLSRGVGFWSEELIQAIDDTRRYYVNQGIGELRRAGQFKPESAEEKRFWDALDLDFMLQTEHAMADGIVPNLNELANGPRPLGGYMPAIQNLPFRNPEIIKKLVDASRESAVTAYIHRESLPGVATPAACRRLTFIYANIVQKSDILIPTGLPEGELDPQRYKTVSLHSYYEALKHDDPRILAALEEVARTGFRDANKEKYDLRALHKVEVKERLVQGGGSNVASEVAQGVAKLKEALKDPTNAKRAAASVGVAAVFATTVPHAAAAAGQPAVGPSSPANVNLSSLFSATPMAPAHAGGADFSLRPELFSATPMTPAASRVEAARAKEAMVSQAVAAGFSVDMSVAGAAMPAEAVSPSDEKSVAQAQLNRTISEGGAHAGAAQILKEVGEVPPAVKNEALSNTLITRASEQLEAVKTSDTLSAKAAEQNLQYVAYLLAAAENPAIFDGLTAEQKADILSGKHTVAPDAAIALARLKWTELSNEESGTWAGYTEEQQKLVTILMASIDISMMSQKEIVALLPKEEVAPDTDKKPEVEPPKIGKQIADAFAETTNRLIKKGSEWRNRAIAINYFRLQGYSLPQATALVGNFVIETGSDVMNPGTHQNGGPAQGMAQWEGGRLQRLFVFAENRGKQWNDLQTQLDFVIAELKGGEKAANAKLKQAETIEEATEAVMLYYERPYDAIHRNDGPKAKEAYEKNLDKRVKAAKRAHAGYTAELAKVKAEQKAAADAAAKAKAAAEAKAKAKAEAEKRAAEQRSHNEIIETPISKYGYGLPVSAENWANHKISFEYGEEYYWRPGETYHTGTDIILPTGTKLYSLKKGKVTFADVQGNTGIKTIVIEFFDGTFANYQHLDSYDVKEGDVVEQGELIGRSGNSGAAEGYSTVEHLHLTIGKTSKDADGLVTSYDALMREKTDDPEDLLVTQQSAGQWAKRN